MSQPAGVACPLVLIAEGGFIMKKLSTTQVRIAAGMAGVAMALIAHAPSRSVKAAPAGFYEQTNLVSDQPGVAQIQDTNLVNAWGIALNPSGGAFWVADNVTGKSTLYTGDVNGSPFTKASLVVTIAGRHADRHGVQLDV
jgi:hypothetical protein